MNNIKIASAALNQIPLDWEGNYNRICDAIDLAVEQNVTLLCLPELCITGYSLEDLFFAPEVHKRSLEYLFKIQHWLLDRNYTIVISVGLPVYYEGSVYNVAAILNDQDIFGFVPKQNLANDGVHYESRWFKPGIAELETVYYTNLGNQDQINFGDLVFKFGDIRVGFEICEDLWVANRPGISLSQRAVDIILNPSASHFAFGKHEIREQMIVDSSRALKCAYVYSNLLGNEAGRVIFEGDNLIACCGKLIASGPRMSFKDVILTTAIIDTDFIKTQKAMNGSFHPPKIDYEIINCEVEFETCVKTELDNQLLAEPLNKYDEFIFAESLGLFDYMRKSHSNAYVLSISGGCDSTVMAALVRFMYDRGVKQLGEDKFNKKSGLKIDPKLSPMSQILTCIYQSTENSGEITYNAAKNVSESIGATFINWDVNSIMNTYIGLIESNIGKTLNWNNDDIALQNIQARIRVPGIWMIANIKQALLICTSNRSEMAVGYSTADGDLAGSLSPISGVDKEFLLSFLDELHFRSSGPEGNAYYGPTHWTGCVESVVNQKPTAELRPQSELQSDESDLMPYYILQHIEHLAIVEKKFPSEVLECIIQNYSDITVLKLKEYVNKFFKLWVRNQWKKDKSPIGFVLDEECLDPKTNCRFPTLCANFEEI